MLRKASFHEWALTGLSAKVADIIAAVAHGAYLALGIENLAHRMIKGRYLIDINTMFNQIMRVLRQ